MYIFWPLIRCMLSLYYLFLNWLLCICDMEYTVICCNSFPITKRISLSSNLIPPVHGTLSQHHQHWGPRGTLMQAFCFLHISTWIVWAYFLSFSYMYKGTCKQQWLHFVFNKFWYFSNLQSQLALVIFQPSLTCVRARRYLDFIKFIYGHIYQVGVIQLYSILIVCRSM